MRGQQFSFLLLVGVDSLQLSRRTIVRTLPLALPLPPQVAWAEEELVSNRANLCITALPNFATYNASAPTSQDTRCDKRGGVADGSRLQIYAADLHLRQPDLRSFTCDFVVPPLPAKYMPLQPHVVYFWPGLKSGKPEMGYPVLQPVLQYGVRGPSWTLQSWFVDVASVAARPSVVSAPAIDVSPGDRITSFIGLEGDGSTWTVSGVNRDTNHDSTLHVADSRVQFDFAMLVNENINVNAHCERMPASMSERMSLTFTNVTVNGDRLPAWETRANCAGKALCDCGNVARVNAENGDVTLSWRPRWAEL